MKKIAENSKFVIHTLLHIIEHKGMDDLHRARIEHYERETRIKDTDVNFRTYEQKKEWSKRHNNKDLWLFAAKLFLSYGWIEWKNETNRYELITDRFGKGGELLKTPQFRKIVKENPKLLYDLFLKHLKPRAKIEENKDFKDIFNALEFLKEDANFFLRNKDKMPEQDRKLLEEVEKKIKKDYF